MVDGLRDFIRMYGIRRRGGKLVLYKAVSEEWGSLWQRSKHPRGRGRKDAYCPGTEVSVRRWNEDRHRVCGTGLHVGTLECARRFLREDLLFDAGPNRRLVRVLVDPEDVVCVPMRALELYSGDQKIRCKRLLVETETNREGRGQRPNKQ